MKLSTRDITAVSLFTALHVAAAAMLRFGGEAVLSFSLVPLFVVLAGLLLGKKGAASLLVYALLGLMGIPVFSKPPFGGMSYLLQPSFGFIIGYILAALVIGWFVDYLNWSSPPKLFFAAVVGLIVLYAVGLPYLYLVLRYLLAKTLTLKQLMAIGFWPFVGLDLLKAGLAVALATAVRRRLPQVGR